ncbi:MAG: Chromosome partition protein smc [Candidatus Magasanikbacteria bacterium GW2011_GWA2_42_32]|uniref:Chromosome partition protein smc n=2 Tax=Parcubacteria group TaxID=1794811 RepID=A0A0G1CV21_9BACT|nr:MAG: Chromosome partition protein smc [Candidatus Magasanikbacteria bacterium GW2011_GWA2_42_32]OGZ00964.1 MAG: hypothetical protein A3B13_02600 [Candidatus Liptonbacteria bacterium RIFCSPLOWO2_01_FULL_45_15]
MKKATMSKNKKSKMTLDKLAIMTQGGFLEVNKRFDKVEERLGKVEVNVAVLSVDMREVKSRLDKIEETMSNLTTTLDAFLKRLTDHEEEFKILKREVKIMKSILKEKLNVDVDVLRHG